MNYRKWLIGKSKKLNFKNGLIMGSMGLSGEAGEVLDHIKKVIFAKHKLDKDHIIEELGDTYFYMEYLTYILGTTMDEVKSRNVIKLNKRYGKKYSNKASQLRVDSKK